MKLGLMAALALTTSCAKAPPSPSCAERVATMAAHLATPRSHEELRAAASEKTRPLFDQILAEPYGSGRAGLIATLLEPLVASCPPALEVFGGVASIEGDKTEYLRTRAPAAFEACSCKASPEDAGALLEALLGDWRK